MHAGLARWLPLALVAAAAGCHQDPEPLDLHVEDLVTIEQGIYGQVTYYADNPFEHDHYSVGFDVGVYAVPPGRELGEPVATTETGERGFYEVALAPGEWIVCTAYMGCVSLTVGVGETPRLDYVLGGPGWAGGTQWPPPDPP